MNICEESGHREVTERLVGLNSKSVGNVMGIT